MAALTFSYRSIKDIAPLETRLSYKDENQKRCSIYSRSRIEVSREFWEQYKEGKSFRDSVKLNLKAEIDQDINDLRKYTLDQFKNTDLTEINKDWLKETINSFYDPKPKQGAVPTDLLKYFNYYLDLKEHELKESKRSWQKWITVRNKLEKLIESNTRYKIAEVNESFVRDWTKYCQSHNYSNQTTKKEFSYIKTVCTHAKNKGLEVSPDLASLKVNLKASTKPKIYLNFDELELIGQAKNLPEHLENSKDWLLISCYTGQRVSDFMRFNSSMLRTSGNKTFLDIRQVKTGKEVSIPILPNVLEILDKREGNFPKPLSDQKYNRYIKEVAKLAGLKRKVKGGLRIDNRLVIGSYPKWKLISSHIGRRSFATNFYGKMPTTYLKNITGHGTEQMLLTYIGKTSKDTALDSYDKMLEAIK